MNISVSFFGVQRDMIKTNQVQIPLSERIRVVEDLFKYIKEEYPELPLSKESVLVTVNDHVSPLDRELKSDDEVFFMPHIGGG